MTPEEKARQIIDHQLTEAGWLVVDRDHMSTSENAMAVREALLNHNLEADYLLFQNNRVVGVIEAKREEIDVETDDAAKSQAIKYANNIPDWVPGAFYIPLPIAFVANGQKILVKDLRKPDSDFKLINRFPSPYELLRNYPPAVNSNYFAGLPHLRKQGLRDCQYSAIRSLEVSFRVDDQKRALLVLATGSGKTYTACMLTYRMLTYTPCQRVLFLVDRNNLGDQTLEEFGKFKLTDTGELLSNIYSVNKLYSKLDVKNSEVVISTIQRLFSYITGQEIVDNDSNEESDFNDSDNTIIQLNANEVKIPRDFFDAIIIDECHRSIYGKWRSVLEYFNTARLIGLTATPEPETFAFFNNNQVYEYSFDDSVLDGVNVGGIPYRIKTKVSEDGGKIEVGEQHSSITKYTGEYQMHIAAEEEVSYTKGQVNRSVINPAQIELILQTYKDKVYTEMFPDREPDFNYLPKTLIFALNDQHANQIVEIARKVFGVDDKSDFIKKITYSAQDSKSLINAFNTKENFRIAVTVTLVATGTDVKPLEVVMFMRDVNSATLYTQMKGRGCRTIDTRLLQNVTPNAKEGKDHFYIVDAVGVTEHAMSTEIKSREPQPRMMSMERLLELITLGNLDDDLLMTLANKLSRIDHKASNKQKSDFCELTGISFHDLAEEIFNALRDGKLPPYINNNEPNKERKQLVRPLTDSPDARDLILEINAGYIRILEPGKDELLFAGKSQDEAIRTTSEFKKFVNEKADKIEALRIIYNNTGNPITPEMLNDLKGKLLQASYEFNTRHLWDCYSLVYPDKVTKLADKSQSEALTNIIQLVRFALQRIDSLKSLNSTAAQYFELFCGKRNREISPKQRELLAQVVDYIIFNGYLDFKTLKNYNTTVAANLKMEFKANTNDILYQLANMLTKTA